VRPTVRSRPAALGIAVALLLTALAGCGSGTTAAPDLWTGPKPTTTTMSAADAKAIDAVGQQIIATMGADLPGVWIGVWDAKKGYHVGAYGKAVLPDTPATVDDHGRIGSVSKTFTTATAMRLVDQGKLAMDSTVAQVLPGLAKRYPSLAPVTVAQLIDMTSGIADYVNSGAVFKTYLENPRKTWTPAEIIDLSQTMTNAKPGTAGYTSTATIILGEMIAAVSGQSVEDAVNQTARDAGLRKTALAAPGDPTMPAPTSHGYIFAPGVDSLKEVGATVVAGTDVSNWSPSWGGAAGAMYSTIGDLGLWAGTGFGSTLLSQKLGAARLGGPTTKGAGGDAYGLGLTHWGDNWVGHTGQIIGWESFAAYNVVTGDVVVLMVNETGSLPASLSRLVAVANPELGRALAG
jgi:D-alanyl-D-alanine carboxypeptidase